MRIAIAGAGLAGSYIFRLLGMRGGHQVELYERKHAIACGIHPCGYGVDDKFNDLAAQVGLNPQSYARHEPPRLQAEVAGVRAATTVFMIDKPRFIADLQGGAEVIYGPLETGAYDLVIDATGEARAYAPPLRDDLKARVVQWRVRTTEAAPLAFMPTAGVPGYAWIMPLDPEGREVHVGAGCLQGLGIPARKLVATAFRSLSVEETVCACGARIRLSGPDFTSVVHDNIWAVGESAGLVGPASGAGNVYAMQSGRDLVDHLGDEAGYLAAIKSHFRQLVPEARAVRRVLLGKLPAPADIYHIRQGWHRAGVQVAWRDVPRLMVAMKHAFAGVSPE